MATAERALACESVISLRAADCAVAVYRVGGRRPDIAEDRNCWIIRELRSATDWQATTAR